MNKFDKAIKEFNLIYTDTVSPHDMCRTDYHFNNQEIDYGTSISLGSVRDTVLRTHKQMLDDYTKLEGLDLGGYYEVLDFLNSSKPNENVRELKIALDSPTLIKADENFVYFVDNNGKLRSFVTNGYYLLDDNYKKIELDISDEKIKEYLDLFGKYKPLLDYYNYYKNNVIFESGSYTLCSAITTAKDRFNSPIKNLEFYGHIDHFLGKGDSFTINTLGSGKINLDRSSFIIEDEDMDLSSSAYNRLLESIYVNRKYLDKTFNPSTEDNFGKVLKLK